MTGIKTRGHFDWKLTLVRYILELKSWKNMFLRLSFAIFFLLYGKCLFFYLLLLPTVTNLLEIWLVNHSHCWPRVCIRLCCEQLWNTHCFSRLSFSMFIYLAWHKVKTVSICGYSIEIIPWANWPARFANHNNVIIVQSTVHAT